MNAESFLQYTKKPLATLITNFRKSIDIGINPIIPREISKKNMIRLIIQFYIVL